MRYFDILVFLLEVNELNEHINFRRALILLPKVKRKYCLGEWSICAEIVFISVFHSEIIFLW